MPNHDRGMLDTSVVIEPATIHRERLPLEASISALTLAERTSGPLSAKNSRERAERFERLQWAEGTFEAIPFDAPAARAYGRKYSATISITPKPRGARAVDLLIAATALSRGLPLFTRNPSDFKSAVALLEVVVA